MTQVKLLDEPTQAALKAAEKRGYGRGHAAGKKLAKRRAADEKLCREREAFRRRVFLAVLPVALGPDMWKRGDVPIKSLKDRMELAVEFADAAMRHF